MLSERQMDAAAASPLFKGIEREKIELFLRELKARPAFAAKNAILIGQGEGKSDIHIVLSGEAVGERLEADGHSTVINEFRPGDLFGDMLSGGEEKSPVAVRMTAEGELLKISFSALLTQREDGAGVREAVLRNLFREISQKYFGLMRRLNMLLCPTLRGKIALYLLEQAGGEKSFISPHSRARQAELLCCDRSALSRELSRMGREEMIFVSGAHFEILDEAALSRLAAGSE